MPPAAVDYLQRGTGQGSWPLVVAAQVVGTASATTGFAGTTAAPEHANRRRFPAGDALAAYTGLVLADLASRGRVRLDDPIQRHLPAGFQCADRHVCALTLQQLASQASGLPPLPANLFAADPARPWQGYGEADLLDFLANYRLPAERATRESTLSTVLLAWLLGRATGEDFASLLHERVSVPLGLTDTGMGWSGAGGQASAAALPVALHTSAEDQLRLLRAQLRPGDTPLRAALLLSRQPQGAAGWGLGWRIQMLEQDGQDWPLVWQQGQAAGHAMFLGFRTDRQQAVALLANAETSLVPLGLSLLQGNLPPPLPPPPYTDAGNPADFVGLYEFSPGRQLLIRATAEGLSAQASGRLDARLQALAPDLYALAGSSARLSFQRDALGRVDRLRWAENGLIVPVQRLSTRAPQLLRTAQALPAERLAEYCGDYRVDDDVLARFGCGARPTLQFSGAQARELSAFADDRFASSDGEFELHAQRSADGRVDGLRLFLLGHDMLLPRVQWTPLPAEVLASLRQERNAREHARREATARIEVQDMPAAPWTRALPVLAPLPLVPYRIPGFVRPAATPAVATSTAAAATAHPSVVNTGAAPASPTSSGAATRAGNASVSAAPAGSAAKIEPLPERFERPRFTPPAAPQPDKQEREDDGT